MSAIFKRGSARVAPRYRFSEDEKEIVRFTTSRHTRIFKTPIFDISESGISFLTSTKLAPQVGEIIKMDFSPLGSVRMACLGRVMRIEEPTSTSAWSRFPTMVKVGIAFHDLPRPYRKVLSDSLLSAFGKKNRSPQHHDVTIEVKARNPSWIAQNFWSVAVTLLILCGGGYGLFYVIQNSSGDGATAMNKQAGWASSFFEKTLNK